MTVIPFPVRHPEPPLSGINCRVVGGNVEIVITLSDGTETIAVMTPDNAAVFSDRLVNDALMAMMSNPIANY